MNLRHLSIFQAVAEAGGIRAAARNAGLTQPAMSYAIQELERSIGAPLFERSAKGVTLTPIGEALLIRARLLLNDVRRAKEEIAQLRDGAGGRLRVTFSSFAAAQILPRALLAFRERWPDTSLELQELSGVDVPGLWTSGDFDFVILSELDTPEPDNLVREVLLDMPLIVIARAGHPLARVRSFARLREAMWAVPPYGAALVRTHFAAAGVEAPRDMVICHSWQLGSTLVREAGALTIGTSSVMAKPATSRGLVALRLAEKLPNVHVSLLMRNRALLTPAARAFADELRTVARGLQPR